MKPDKNAEISVPASFDWRARGAVTRVKDQKLCGSCYAMSTVGSIESHNFIQNGELIELSEQEIVDCADDYGTFHCAGGVSFRVFDYVKERGLSSAADYPYESKEGECRPSAIKDIVDVKGFGYIKSSKNDETLMRAVSEIGPMAISMDIDHESFMRYSSGIYFDKNCTDEINHGALLVGYGNDNGVDYWIIKNSFGLTWGENGYVRVARNLGSNCGITSVALYPILKKKFLTTTTRTTSRFPQHSESKKPFPKTTIVKKSQSSSPYSKTDFERVKTTLPSFDYELNSNLTFDYSNEY